MRFIPALVIAIVLQLAPPFYNQAIARDQIVIGYPDSQQGETLATMLQVLLENKIGTILVNITTSSYRTLDYPAPYELFVYQGSRSSLLNEKWLYRILETPDPNVTLVFQEAWLNPNKHPRDATFSSSYVKTVFEKTCEKTRNSSLSVNEGEFRFIQRYINSFSPENLSRFSDPKLSKDDRKIMINNTLFPVAAPKTEEDYLKGAASGDETAIKELISDYRYKANNGNAEERFKLGRLYDQGKYVPQSDHEAAYWYRRAAELGHAEAQAKLGWKYEKGRGVPQDDAEALFWTRLAAEKGNPNGQTQLAFRYFKGKGVPQDYAETARLYRLAADQGHSFAQCNLAGLYENGQGVEKNLAEAFKLYRQAALQGDARGQFHLGNMYINGQGVEKNQMDGRIWVMMAAKNGNKKAYEQGLEIYQQLQKDPEALKQIDARTDQLLRETNDERAAGR